MRTQSEERLESAEIRSRAATGVMTVGLRNVLVRVIGLGGTVILARILEPRDFGLLAFGLTVQYVGSVLTSGGLGAELVRRDRAPTRDELRCVLGFQLVGTVALTGAIVVVGLLLGGAAAIAAVMALSLPIAVCRIPTNIVLERTLNWGLLARVAVTEILVYNVVAIALALAGAGVWGVAAAVVVYSLVGSVLLIARGPVGLLSPLLSLTILRPLWRFGVVYQATSLLGAARVHGVTVIIAAVGGLVTLGLWSVAYRILQAIALLLQALSRVAFPAMSRLLQSGDDAPMLLERSFRLTAVPIGLVAAVVGGTAPDLVPAVFGSVWSPAAAVLPWGAAALIVSGPISTSAVGFLQAKGEARLVLRIMAVQAGVWLSMAALLVPTLGVEGGGIAMFVGALSLRLSLGRALRRHVRIRLNHAVWAPTLAALAAGLLGWLTARAIDPSSLGLVVSLTVVVAVYLTLVFSLRRDDSLSFIRILRRTVAGARHRSEPVTDAGL